MKTQKCKQKGVVLVEMAIVLPLFLLLLIGTVEFGVVLHDYLILQNASREGARFGAVGNSTAAVQQRVKDFAPNLDGNQVSVVVTNAQGERGSSLTVTANYPVPLITSLMKALVATDSFALQAKSVMRLE